MNLRRRMAEFGFESNDDYEFQMRCLFAASAQGVRCLHVAGDSGRRKTAFAQSLAHALDYPRVLYLDFSQPEPPAPVVSIAIDPNADHHEPVEAPLGAFERVVTEACAFSEAERTVLILDQLQAAEFQQQIQLAQFAASGLWHAGAAEFKAGVKNLLLVLISEETLYHPLARMSFRVWTDASAGRFEFRPDEFGLDPDARELFAALAALFEGLGRIPTPSELRHILADLLEQVRTEEQLRHCLYGWMEQLDHALLVSPTVAPLMVEAVAALNRYIGLDEVVLHSGHEAQDA